MNEDVSSPRIGQRVRILIIFTSNKKIEWNKDIQNLTFKCLHNF